MYKPNYSITPKVLNSIAEIAEIKAVIERSKVLPLNEAQLRRQAIVRMVHTSTSIEGNNLAEYQVDKVLSGMSLSADQKSILEVKNYQKALVKMEKMVTEKDSISIEDILNLHKILMEGLLPKEKIGHFRPADIFIVDDLGDGRETLRYQGPKASKVAYLVNELLKWHKESKSILHPVILAGIFHTQFVHIHPFTDGNGRITRILTTYLLYKSGWDFRRIIVLEDYYNQERQAYYNALALGWDKTYQEGSNISGWLEYFTFGFLIEARKVLDSISAIGFAKISGKDEQVYLDKDEIKIMDFLATVGKITSNDVMEILLLAKRTAQLKLKGLVDKKLITSQGNGPSTYYILQT